MTTDDILSLIRCTIPLISRSLTKTMMHTNVGQSQGQASLAMRMQVIGTKDFTELSKEIAEEIEKWHNGPIAQKYYNTEGK